jgi:hypothetical protein
MMSDDGQKPNLVFTKSFLVSIELIDSSRKLWKNPIGQSRGIG